MLPDSGGTFPAPSAGRCGPGDRSRVLRMVQRTPREGGSPASNGVCVCLCPLPEARLTRTGVSRQGDSRILGVSTEVA